MAIALIGVLCLSAQETNAGYADGMSQYSAYHVMHGGVDPSGLASRWINGPKIHPMTDLGANLRWRTMDFTGGGLDNRGNYFHGAFSET